MERKKRTGMYNIYFLNVSKYIVPFYCLKNVSKYTGLFFCKKKNVSKNTVPFYC